MTDTGRNPTPIAGSDAGRMKLARSIDEFSERILLLLTPQSFALARSSHRQDGAYSEVAAARLFRCSLWVRVEKKLAHLARRIA